MTTTIVRLPAMNLDFFQRIAFSDFDTMRKAQDFIRNHGGTPGANQNEIAVRLAEIVNHRGESVLPELMKIHPDAELILDNQPRAVEKKEEIVKHIVLADDATQQAIPAKEKVQDKVEQYMPLIVVTTLFIIGAITITATTKNK